MKKLAFYRLLAGILIAVACALTASASIAQQNRPAPSIQIPAGGKKPEAGKMFEDWGVECEAQADKSEVCFISQSHFSNPGNQRIIYFRVGYLGPKGEVVVVASLPLGIDIPAGTMMKFEPGPQVLLTVQSCDVSGCRAVATLDAAAQKALREAKGISVIMLPFGSAQATSIQLSVKGLAPAFASLK